MREMPECQNQAFQAERLTGRKIPVRDGPFFPVNVAGRPGSTVLGTRGRGRPSGPRPNRPTGHCRLGATGRWGAAGYRSWQQIRYGSVNWIN